MECPENNCDGLLVQRKGKFGAFYGCTNFKTTGCKGSVQQDPKTQGPAKNAADGQTKDARKKARFLFNKMIESGEMTKDQAAVWVADVLMKKEKRVSIAYLTLEECQRLIRVMEATSGNS